MDIDKKEILAQAQIIDENVGRRIRHSRIYLGISRQELAEYIGITHQQLYKYEKGKNRISAGKLYMLAQKLGKKIQYFFYS